MTVPWPSNHDLHSEHLKLLADHRETMIRLRDLRDEFRDFRAHVGANLAGLNELAAELLDRFPDTGVAVGALRAMTWHLDQQFRGETRPGDWDPEAEYARLAGDTEADKPGRPVCGTCGQPEGECVYPCDNVPDDPCPVEAVFPDSRLPCLLQRGHYGDHQFINGETEPDEPEPQEHDPGDEVDDMGGMSEYRYLTAPEEPHA